MPERDGRRRDSAPADDAATTGPRTSGGRNNPPAPGATRAAGDLALRRLGLFRDDGDRVARRTRPSRRHDDHAVAAGGDRQRGAGAREFEIRRGRRRPAAHELQRRRRRRSSRSSASSATSASSRSIKPRSPKCIRPLAQTFMFPMAFVARTPGAARTCRGGAAGGVRRGPDRAGRRNAAAHHAHRRHARAGRACSRFLSVFAGGRSGAWRHRRLRRRRLPCAPAGTRVRHSSRARGAPDRDRAGRAARRASATRSPVLAIGVPVAFLLTRVMEYRALRHHDPRPLTFTVLPVVIATTTLHRLRAPPPRRAATGESGDDDAHDGGARRGL